MTKLHFRDRAFVIETYRQQISAYQKLFDFEKYTRASAQGKRKYIRDARTVIANLTIVEQELEALLSEKRKHYKRDPLKTVQDEAHLEAVRAIMNNLWTNLSFTKGPIAGEKTRPAGPAKTKKKGRGFSRV
jgi:hypothetical protein